MSIKGYINFKATHEDWSEYKLKDGAILKARFILNKLLATGNYDVRDHPQYDINSTYAVGILVPEKLRGNPSQEKPSLDELERSIVEDNIAFEVVKEGWNTYELENGAKLSVKLTLTYISRTNKLDSRGEPIYLYRLQPVTKGEILPDLKPKGYK